MRILFCDILFQHGNRHIDNKMLDIMSKENEVYLLMNEDFIKYDHESLDNIIVLGNKYYENPKSWKGIRLQFLKRMRLAAKTSKKIKADLVYISTYKTSVFPFGLLFFHKKNRIVVVENNNIDLLKDKVNRITYSLFANKVHHLVYEPFFKDYLVSKISVKEHLIHFVPHLQYFDTVSNNSSQEQYKSYDCIAISGSNDSCFVQELVNLEKKYRVFENNRISVRIKCKSIEYHSEFLEVNGDFIKDKEYNYLYNSCKVVLVPFPLSYEYRMSGCIVDAFSYHKPVISNNIKLSEFYSRKYGFIIRTVNSPMEMIYSIFLLIKEEKDYQYDFSAFEYDHNQDMVKKRLDYMINKITNQK